MIQATEQVDRIEVISEEATISEVITRNANVKNIVEGLAVSESISKVNTTPPFKWGPTGANQGVWNASEWA